MRKKAALTAALAVTLLLFAAGSGGYAQGRGANPPALMSGADRGAVHEALLAVRKRQWQKAEGIIARTKDPLAAKVYYWLYYTKDGGPVQFNRISAFVRQNPGWPKIGTLRLAAEKSMPDDLADVDVIGWYDSYPPLTSDGMDRYMAALLKTGAKDKAAAAINAWWRKTSLTPDQQRYFYGRYGGLLTKESNIARFGYTLMLKQYINARGLARVLGHGYPDLAEARIALAQGGGNLDALIARVPPQLQDDPGLLLERLRWRRRNNKDFGAIEILHNMPPVAIIPNPDDWWQERHILARRLMEKGRFESAYLLLEKHQQKEGIPFAEAEFLAGWLALKIKKPERAFERFESLYHKTETPISRSRGAYWAGRASEALGNPDIARQWYQTAARYQIAFYGQLAIAKLDDAYKPPQQLPPEKTLAGQTKFDALEMVQMAKFLSKAGFRDDTSAFLDALAEDVKTPDDYLLVAELATELNHRHNAVRIAKKGLQKGILLMDQAYPTMLTSMKKVDLEWALVHALIRQESAFDFAAVSPAGARGLMQLMPATAKEVARKNRISHSTDMLISNPDHNIRLGSLYLKQVLDRFDGSHALALAAYNAGPGRVDQWIKMFGDPRNGAVDVTDWIEMIPIGETRNYVQRVLEGAYIYRIKLQDAQKNFNSPVHKTQKN